MSICLLDSGILIDVLTGKRGRAEMVAQLIREGSELACCSINVTEVYAGLKSGEEDKTERLLRSLRFYDVTWEIARLAGSLQSHWRQQGRPLALPGATIAAIAVAHKLVLVTNNTRDFPMPELTLYPVL